MESANEISEQLLEEIESLKGCQDRTKDEKLLATIHSMGISLWNVIVGKKAGKKIELVVCARGTLPCLVVGGRLLGVGYLNFLEIGGEGSANVIYGGQFI